ncbi:MAG: DNA-processing protein DprA [Gemmatimonadota bacterium]
MAPVGERAPAIGREAGALLALDSADYVGPVTVTRLLERYESPLRALEAAARSPLLTRRQRQGVAAVRRGRTAEATARDAAARARDEMPRGARLVTCVDPAYPHRLRRLHHPPVVLWAWGPLAIDAPRTVAVVGTRRATREARGLAFEIGAGLARRGVRVVSGMAAGIDAAAHRGAASVGGETVGVLGSGLRFTYPVENVRLYDRMRADGLLLTEFEPGERPVACNFPRRNRIVAALADAVVVVQAGPRSGALLTVGHAIDIGVDVMACPGPVSEPGSAGCHDLLRDGAGLVTSAEDVCRLLARSWGGEDVVDAPGPADSGDKGDPGPAATVPAAWDPTEAAVLARLDVEPAALDELAGLGGGAAAVAGLLTRLELEGAVRGLPGCRYERCR